MILHAIMRRIKRRHDAIWVDVRWLEPLGFNTWAVCVKGFAPSPERELARSRSLLVALWCACWAERP